MLHAELPGAEGAWRAAAHWGQAKGHHAKGALLGGGAAGGEEFGLKGVEPSSASNPAYCPMAEVDSQARKELLKQIKIEIDTILDMEGGQEFVTKLVKGE